MTLRVNVIEPVGGHGGMNYYNSGLAIRIAANGGIAHLYTCDRTREVSSGSVNIEKKFRKIWGSGNKALRFLRFIKGTLSSIFAMKGRGDRFCHLHFFEYNLEELMPCLALKIAGLKITATVHDIEASRESLANNLNRILAMDTNNISREAIRTMQESYDWSQIGKQHLEVYKRYVN